MLAVCVVDIIIAHYNIWQMLLHCCCWCRYMGSYVEMFV